MSKKLNTVQIVHFDRRFVRGHRTETAVFIRVLQAVEALALDGIDTSRLIPRTAILVKILETRQMAAVSSAGTDIRIPRTALGMRVHNTLQTAHDGGAG